MGVRTSHGRPGHGLGIPSLLGLVAVAIAACASGPRLPTSGPQSSSPVADAATGETACPTGGQADQDVAPPPGSIVELSCIAVVPRALSVTTPPDASGRMFVTSQNGQIWSLGGDAAAPNGSAVLPSAPLLDLSSEVSLGPERGLLGLAFAPRFPADPRLFVDYSDLAGHIVVSSFLVQPADPRQIRPGSEEVILQIDHPQPIHNGGALEFGADGYLYISVGDGGLDPDLQEPPQGLLGRILRIDVDHRANGQAYAIPAGNPIAAGSSAPGETWLTGFRNPWRMSFDPPTGDLWIGDVGANTWEEVDVARAGQAGLDFGWPVMEGFQCYETAPLCDAGGLTQPVAEYPHDPDCAITGGYVYRGAAIPSLDDQYVFGDFCSGRIYSIPADEPGPAEPRVIGQTGAGVAAFGEDASGELYVANVNDGAVSRLVALP